MSAHEENTLLKDSLLENSSLEDSVPKIVKNDVHSVVQVQHIHEFNRSIIFMFY